MSDFERVFSRYRPLVDDWEAFLASLERPLPTCIWANPLRTTGEALAAGMAATGVTLEPLPWLPGAFRLPRNVAPGNRLEYVAGLYHVQEEVSLLPVLLLDPRPGDRVLDLCAAPGGKTARLAAAMGNRGTVVANDRDLQRLTTLRANLDRLGVMDVSTTSVDGANYPPESGLFDRVLADVPCSCEGTCRKHPEVLLHAGRAAARRMSGVQRALLRKAVRLCRPGGRIVYSTCTWAPEENELVLADVLGELPAGTLRVVPARVPGFAGSPGITAWEGRDLPPELRGALRIWPHEHDTGGFFVAILEKGGGAADGGEEAAEDSGVAADGLPPAAEESLWRPYLSERFGFPAETFADVRIFFHSRRRLAAAPREHRPPWRPRPYTIGLTFAYPQMAVPKLTHTATLAWGGRARRNGIDVSPSQAADYLARRSFFLAEDQERSATGPGYVIVRYRGVVLGLALLRRTEAGGQVESLFPKRWAAFVETPEFGGVATSGDRPGVPA